MGHRTDYFLPLDLLRDILSGLPVPLPTIPILVLVALMTLISAPSYFSERRKNEMYIRLICGATRLDVVQVLFN